mgnify:CR=1 FL=1
MNINNLIDLSSGLALTCISLSGIKCINGRLEPCSKDNTESCNKNNTSCSKWNLNIGLSGMAITGGLMMYRGLKS